MKSTKKDKTACVQCGKKLKNTRRVFCSDTCKVLDKKQIFYPKIWSKYFINKVIKYKLK